MENRYYIYSILVVVLISIALVGCSKPVETNEPLPPSPTPDIQPPATTVEPSPTPQVEEYPAELKTALAKNTRVTSLSYILLSPFETVGAYYVLDDKLKVTYSNSQDYNKFTYYALYMDASAQTAYLVCDDIVKCKGRKAMEVPYAAFKKTDTPFEAIQRISGGSILETTQIDNKESLVVQYTLGGVLEKVWVWTFWGIPLQFELPVDGKARKVTYSKLVVNSVAAADVFMPEGLEIV